MQKSKFLQQIGDENNALFFHSLFGYLFLLNKEYIQVLNSFSLPREIQSDDPENIIQELRDVYYLVNETTDEREILRQRNDESLASIMTGKHVYSLSLMVSKKCNFGCPHCFFGQETQERGIMTWDIAKKAIDYYFTFVEKNNINIPDIHFGSAEPLLNWDIIEKSCLYALSLNQACIFSINTNLSLLDKEKAIFLRDNKVAISASLDGLKEGNDKIRMYKNGKGTFDHIMNGIDILEKIQYPLDSVSITLNDLNIPYINDEFLKWIKQKEYTSIANDIDLVNEAQCQKPVDYYVELLLHIYDVCKENNIDSSGTWTTPYLNLIQQKDKELITFCAASQGQGLCFDTQGMSVLCDYSSSRFYHLDEIEKMFEERSRYHNFIKSRLPGNNPECYGCELEGICAGQCHVTYEADQIVNTQKRKKLCELYKKITTQMLERKLEDELKV